MSTAFQSNAFQSDAFQIHGGVTSGAITGTMDYTNEDDSFSGTADLGEGLLNAKLIARWPNVYVRFGKKKPVVEVADEPSVPEITNMPDAPAPKRTGGLNLDLVKAPPPAPASPKPAVAPPEITFKALPETPPPLEVAKLALVDAPVPAPVVVAKPSPPAEAKPPPPSDLEVNVNRLLEGLLKGNEAQTERVLMAFDTLTARVQELQAEIATDRKARDLRERNLLRAKQIADKLLMDLGN